jgi:phosphatidylglycerol---prolipoprotein diacylglyceryl transferase
MLPIVNLGPLAIPVPALVVLAGIWICIYLAEKFAPRFGLSAAKISSLIILMLVSGVIGARLTYLLRYPEAFIQHPADILSRSPGLLDPFGGITLAVITGYVYALRKGLPLWATLDALTPGLAALAICISLSNLASGDAFGKPTDLPWGIYIWGDYRHPIQIYEIILLTLLFGFIITNTKKMVAAKPGTLFLTFLASCSVIYLFVEAFRGDSLLFMETYRTVQLIAWLVLALSLWGIREHLGKHTESIQGFPLTDKTEDE